MSVIIGMDPHKRSATTEVVDEDGRRLPVGQPPNGEAWPASPIPDGADLSAHPPAGRHHSVAHLSALQPPSLLETAAALPDVSGSLGLEVLRRLRPVPDRSVDGGPSPSTHAGCVGSGKTRNGSRVHLQLARRRRSPTLSLRHRHGYPAALHRGLPGEHPHAHPRVPHPTSPGWVRTAPGPYPPDLSR